MLFVLLLSDAQTMNQAEKYPVTFLAELEEQYLFTPTFQNLPLYFQVSSLSADSVFTIEICDSLLCETPFMTYSNIDEPTVLELEEFSKNTEYILKIISLSHEYSVEISFEEYDLVFDHMVDVMALENGESQFVFINCENTQTPLHLTVDATAKLYLSKEERYVNENDCTGDYCGVSDVTVADFSIIRGTIVSDLPEINLMASEAPFTDTTLSGGFEEEDLSKSLLCSGFFKMDISSIFNEQEIKNGIDFMSIIAHHYLPYKDGTVTLKVSRYDDFSETVTDINGEVYLDENTLLTFVDSEVLYLRVSENTYLHPTDMSQSSKILVSGAVNVEPSKVRSSFDYTLFPYYKDEDLVSRNAGSKLFAYDFQTVEYNPTIKEEGAAVPVIAYYAFRMTTDLKDKSYVDSNIYISEKSMANETNTMMIAQDIFENNVFGSVGIAESVEGVEEEKFISQSEVFVTGTVQKIEIAQDVDPVESEFTADVVTELSVHEELNEPAQAAVSKYFYRIPRTSKAAERGGAVVLIEMQECDDAQKSFSVYTSTNNPLPDELMYQSFKGKFSANQLIEIPYETLEYEQDYFSIIKDSGMCNIEINTYLHGDNVEELEEGEQVNTIVLNNEVVEYAVNLDGYSYSKQNGWVQLESKDEIVAKYALTVLVTETEIFSDIDAINNYLYKETFTGDFSVHELTFSLKGNQRFFVSVKRTSINPEGDETAASIDLEAGSFSELRDQLNTFVPVPEKQYPALLQYKISLMEDIHFSINQDVDLYHCGTIIPVLAEFSEICKIMSKDSSGNYQLLSTDSVLYSSGQGYIALLRNENTVDGNVVKIEPTINERIAFGQFNKIETAGQFFAFASELPYSTLKEDDFVVEIAQCNECIICLSSTEYVPRYNQIKPESSTCQLMAGNVTNLSSLKTTIKQYISEGIKEIYGTIQSYNLIGINDEVDFRISLSRHIAPDGPHFINLGFTEKEHEIADGVVFYPKINYEIDIPKSILSTKQSVSLSVGPKISDDQTVDELAGHHYAVFISPKAYIPSITDNSRYSFNELGIVSMDINRTQIESIIDNSCAKEEDVNCELFISIEALRDEKEKFASVETFFAVDEDEQKPSNITSELIYSEVTNTGILSAGQRKVLSFNLLEQPMYFVVSPCSGNPELRAGKSDFYKRTVGTGSTESENVFQSAQPQNEEIYFIVDQSTEYSGDVNWFFELYDEHNEFSADIVAGNSDPRPGTAIRTFEQGYKSKRIEAQFHPALASGENQNPDNLEYNMFLLQQDGNLNENTACSYTESGFELMEDWKQFSAFEDLYLMQSNVDYSGFVKQAGSKQFYLSVVARQKDVGTYRSYSANVYDFSNLPGAIKVKFVMAGWQVALIVIFCAIVLVAVAISVYFGVRKYQASHVLVSPK